MTGPVPINSYSNVCACTQVWFPRKQVEETKNAGRWGERHLGSRTQKPELLLRRTREIASGRTEAAWEVKMLGENGIVLLWNPGLSFFLK